MRSQVLTAGLLSCLAVSGCIALGGCGSDVGEGADTADDAKAKVLSVRYLIVTGPNGGATYFSPKLKVIKRHGRVLAWTARNEEFTLRTGRRCYERHTEFNRDDTRQARRSAWPWDTDDIHVARRDGVRVLSGREVHTDFADTEFEVRLDDAGRITSTRYRSAENGAVSASRWTTTRYRYPTKTEFAQLVGTTRPRPLCD